LELKLRSNEELQLELAGCSLKLELKL